MSVVVLVFLCLAYFTSITIFYPQVMLRVTRFYSTFMHRTVPTGHQSNIFFICVSVEEFFPFLGNCYQRHNEHGSVNIPSPLWFHCLYTENSRISGSKGRYIYLMFWGLFMFFLKTALIGFHTTWDRVSFSLHPHHHLLSLVFFILAILI